jgi:hypothetical protein
MLKPPHFEFLRWKAGNVEGDESSLVVDRE